MNAIETPPQIVCPRHGCTLLDRGPADRLDDGWEPRHAEEATCPVGNHVLPDFAWGYAALTPLQALPLLPCRQCGGDRPARNVTSFGWTCDACGLSIDASEGAKDE